MASIEESLTRPANTQPPLPRAATLDVVISGPITRAGIPGLCERGRVLLEGVDADLVVCDVGELVNPDAVTVDALARLELTARRLGRRIRFRHACRELQQLVAMMGLGDVLRPGASRLEPWREVEQREQVLGVEEEADP